MVFFIWRGLICIWLILVSIMILLRLVSFFGNCVMIVILCCLGCLV